VFIGLGSCVVRYLELRADERLCDSVLTAAAQKEKEFFLLKKKFTATPEQEVELWVKRANGINGGKPVGRRRLCRIATLSHSATSCFPTRDHLGISRAKPLARLVRATNPKGALENGSLLSASVLF
jgi:hypothetical protein